MNVLPGNDMVTLFTAELTRSGSGQTWLYVAGPWSSVRTVVIGEAGLEARFAAGDSAAVRSVYQRYGGLVYSVAHKVLGDNALAEDATQQAFVQAWRSAASYDPARALAPWLAAIARRTAIDVYRRERRHRHHDDLESVVGPSTPPPSADQLSDVWEVREALENLSESDRELIRLQHFGELTHAEIADRLDIPIGTVKSRSHRAHRKLAGLLGHLRSNPVTERSSAPEPAASAGRHAQHRAGAGVLENSSSRDGAGTTRSVHYDDGGEGVQSDG